MVRQCYLQPPITISAIIPNRQEYMGLQCSIWHSVSSLAPVSATASAPCFLINGEARPSGDSDSVKAA
jgi:hypothetical protein